MNSPCIKKESIKKSFLKSLLLIIIIICIESIGYFGMWVNSRSFDFLSNKNYFRIRNMLMGNTNPELFPRYMSLPYLGYVPYPGYKNHEIVQHNDDCYRGNKVPLLKGKKIRVLCLGGSTTYGHGVKSPYETFPAQLEILLNNYIKHDSLLSNDYIGAEVINAGLEAGNSADELQQYVFKYAYYNADIVIVSSGINDALLMADASSDFQLDYTHYRRINFHLNPAPPPASWMLKSYFFSFLSIRLFYNDFFTLGDEFRNQNHQPFSKWTSINKDSVLINKDFEYYPFYKNTFRLYQEIIQDSSVLVVLPNVLNKNSEFVLANKKYNDISMLNISLSKKLAEKFGGIYIPFNYASIKDTTCWIDDCHLNATGEKNKADFIFHYITLAISQTEEKK